MLTWNEIKDKKEISVYYLRKFNEHSVATAFASSVFPVPGGPYNSTPERKRKLGMVNQWY